jgi:hypothetical protein
MLLFASTLIAALATLRIVPVFAQSYVYVSTCPFACDDLTPILMF